jgi:dynein heavy chain 2
MDSKSVEERLGKLTYDLEKRVLFYVGYGLFKADRLMWAVHLIHGMRHAAFKENEWDYFVGDIVDVEKGRCETLPKFAEEEQGSLFRVLSKTFPELVQKLKFEDEKTWNKWARDPQCEVSFPKKLAKHTSAFARLLTVQCLRPDRLQRAIECFACEVRNHAMIAAGP